MSVRIHQLSKQIGMENSELLALLKERGFDVKTASSTIDNISAEALVEEFAKKAKEAAAAQARADAATESSEGGAEADAAKPAPKATLPAGAIVKTKEDLEREKREREEASKPKPPPPKPAPLQSKPAPPPPKLAPLPPPIPARKITSKEAPKPAPPPQAAPREAPKSAPPPQAAPREAPKSAPAPPSGRPAAGSAPRVTLPSQSKPAPAPPEAPKPAQPKTPPPIPVSRPAAEAGPAGTENSDAAAAEPEEGGGVVTEEKVVQVKPPIVVRDFATLLGLKPFRLISELMEMGMFANMNQVIEEEVAQKLAMAHGFKLEIYHRGETPQPKKKKEGAPKVDESELLEPRPPVVCILGHVDHGKTTLLDTIRKTNVVAGEAGGITQHIGAYRIRHNDQDITFIDTPGHAAFSAMRERGANVTDIAILVVAADDGFMPQSDEALRFANLAQVAKLVAINKTDVPGANIDRVKQQMSERGIQSEDWGGETIAVPISALKGEGIEELLEMILLQAEIMELKANPKAEAEGVVIESQIEQGRGPVATVIVQKGTLKVGDTLICGTAYCRVRAMLDDQGKQIKTAGPSSAVKTIGWSDAPEVGGTVGTRKNEREAKREAEDLEHRLKLQMADQATAGSAEGRPSVDDLFAAIEKQEKKSFRVVLRADVAGSLEAISASLRAIDSEKVDLEIVQEDVGIISKNDVEMAHAAEATIIGFNTRMENGVQGLAKHHGINIYIHNIIYELIDLVENAMSDLLDPELREKTLGRAEVRQIFSLGRGQNVAGCMVTEGTITRVGMARVLRGEEVVHDGKVSTLRRFKDDVNEVRAGYECGIRLDNYNDYAEGDVIECFEIEKIRASL